MKIYIISLLNSSGNWGTVFQCYALNKFLLNKGYNAQVINYKVKYEYKDNVKIVIRTFFGRLLNLPKYIVRTYKFNNFINRNINLTKKRYINYKQLLNDCPKGDVYIVGSDQIWNSHFPCGRDLAYYLQFVEHGKKMSYAASLGRDDFTKDELLDIKQKIKDFDYISVRESSGKSQLESVKLKNVYHVCDPVFLLDKEDYLKLTSTKKVKGEYILIYSNRSELLSKAIKKISEKENLKIISIGGLLKKFECDYFYKTAGPAEFLSLINNAKYIVTDSFHCTAFSIIFNKSFMVALQSNPARIKSILQVAGLNDRIMKAVNDIDNIYKPINYKGVNEKLKTHILESKNSFLKALNS